MLADDLVDYPRCFSVVLQLNLSLDEPRLRDAIDFATKRHPLLRACVEYEGEYPKRWVECQIPKYPIDWSDERSKSPGDSERTASSIDLCRQPGVRFRVRRQEWGDALDIEFHHACTDGLGAIQFIHDLLLTYKNGIKNVETILTDYDAFRLSTRDSFGLTGWRRPLRWLYGSAGWLAAIEYLAHRPAMVGTPTTARESRERGSGFSSRFLTCEQTAAVASAAKIECVTVNDLLLRDAFLAIQDLAANHWQARTRDHKRIMVPVSLRVNGDENIPAANIVAMINIDRRPHRWTDHTRMLKVLHLEMQAVKRLRLGLVFVQILNSLQIVFGSLRPFLSRDRCQATCVLSNLGPVLADIGPDVIRAIEFFPPIRPLTSVAIGIVTYQGQMALSLRYDANALSPDQAAELLDRFVSKLLRNGNTVTAAELVAVER